MIFRYDGQNFEKGVEEAKGVYQEATEIAEPGV